MMALSEYHKHAVAHRQRHYDGVLPSWDIFCHTHFWETMLANRSLHTAFAAVTTEPLCQYYIERKHLLLLGDASFQLGAETISLFLLLALLPDTVTLTLQVRPRLTATRIWRCD